MSLVVISPNRSESLLLASERPGLSSLQDMDIHGLKRDADFWFDDGNVIVVAGNTGFRLYRGWLAAESPVFYDMFSINQPRFEDLRSDETSNGCPIVYVTDSAAEFRSLMSTLIRGRQYVHITFSPRCS